MIDEKLIDKKIKVSLQGEILNLKTELTQSIQNQLNSALDNIKTLVNQQKIKEEQMEVFNHIQNETLKKLTTQEVHIDRISKEISSNFYKYDKIYIENLFVPGLIGEYCRFKNLREFTEYSLNTLSSLVNFKENNQLETKSNKERIDNIMRLFNNQIEATQKELKGYSKANCSDVENNLKNEINAFHLKLDEIRLDNIKYAVNLQKSASELKVEQEKLESLKKDIRNEFNLSTKEFKDSTKHFVDEFEKVRTEFDTMKIKFTELSEFIRDIRFRKNIGSGVEVNRREMKTLSNKISYNPIHRHSIQVTPKFKHMKDLSIASDDKLLSLEEEKSLSEDDSVKIGEEREVESVVKKYIQGSTSQVRRKSVSSSKFIKPEKNLKSIEEEIVNSVKPAIQGEKIENNFEAGNLTDQENFKKLISNTNNYNIINTNTKFSMGSMTQNFFDRLTNLKKEISVKNSSSDKRFIELEKDLNNKLETLSSQVQSIIKNQPSINDNLNKKIEVKISRNTSKSKENFHQTIVPSIGSGIHLELKGNVEINSNKKHIIPRNQPIPLISMIRNNKLSADDLNKSFKNEKIRKKTSMSLKKEKEFSPEVVRINKLN